MSVTTKLGHGGHLTSDEAIEAFDLDPELAEARCFTCGEMVFHPAVIWSGVSLIYLHPCCARKLARNIRNDSLRCDEISHAHAHRDQERAV